MKIGLARHFKVIHPFGSFMTSAQFQDWVKGYDTAPVKIPDTCPENICWEACLASDLPRAVETAQALHKGKVIFMESLREVPMAPVFHTKRKLPLAFWLFLSRAAWAISHNSQPETQAQTKKRAEYIASHILSLEESNVLVVSHGFFMIYVRKQMIKNGFKGDRFLKAENGRIYVFENNKK